MAVLEIEFLDGTVRHYHPRDWKYRIQDNVPVVIVRLLAEGRIVPRDEIPLVHVRTIHVNPGGHT